MLALIGRPISSRACLIASTAAPSEAPGARLNEMVVAGKLAEMIDPQRRRALAHLGHDRERHLPDRWRTRQVDRTERVQRGLQFGIGLQDHAILVGLVKIVETMRWPNESYSALSIVAGVMPKRAAVSRSISI